MNRKEIECLREQRAAAFERMKAIHDAAEAESRDLTAEEAQEYERVEREFDQLTARIERAEKLAGFEPRMTRADALPAEETREVAKDEGDEFRSLVERARSRSVSAEERAEAREQVLRHPEYARTFEALIRAAGRPEMLTDEQRATLVVGSGPQGGYTVPDAFYRQLVESRQTFGVIRQAATVIETADHGELTIPAVASDGAAAWLGEAEQFGGDEPTFRRVVLHAHKGGALWKVSDEMLEDSAFDVVTFLGRKLGESAARLENSAFAVGEVDADNKPEGVTNKATVGHTVSAPDAIEADDLIEVQASLPAAYDSDASWYMNRQTAKAVRKLKDSDGNYLWQPGLQLGQPDTLLGRPVAVDEDFPGIAANAKPIIYGDLSGYYIRDVIRPVVKVLNERFADTGEVGVRLHFRVDGDLVDVAAVRALQMGA